MYAVYANQALAVKLLIDRAIDINHQANGTLLCIDSFELSCAWTTAIITDPRV